MTEPGLMLCDTGLCCMQAARRIAYHRAMVLQHRLACSQHAHAASERKLRALGTALDAERSAHEDDVDALLQTLEGLLEGDHAAALAERDAAVKVSCMYIQDAKVQLMCVIP